MSFQILLIIFHSSSQAAGVLTLTTRLYKPLKKYVSTSVTLPRGALDLSSDKSRTIVLPALSVTERGRHAEIVICNNFMNGPVTRGELHGKRSAAGELWWRCCCHLLRPLQPPQPRQRFGLSYIVMEIVYEWQVRSLSQLQIHTDMLH